MASSENEDRRAEKARQVGLFRYFLIQDLLDQNLTARERGRLARELDSYGRLGDCLSWYGSAAARTSCPGRRASRCPGAPGAQRPPQRRYRTAEPHQHDPLPGLPRCTKAPRLDHRHRVGDEDPPLTFEASPACCASGSPGTTPSTW